MKSNNSLNLIPDRRVLVTTKAVLGAGSPSGSEKNPDRQSVGPGSLCAQLVPAGGEDYFFFFSQGRWFVGTFVFAESALSSFSVIDLE